MMQISEIRLKGRNVYFIQFLLICNNLMNNLKSISTSIPNLVNQSSQPQLFDANHTFYSHLYSLYWPNSFSPVRNIILSNNYNLLKLQPTTPILSTSVTTQTIDQDFLSTNQKQQKYLYSEVSKSNKIDKNTNKLAKPSPIIKQLKIQTDEIKKLANVNLKNESSFYRNLNKNIKYKHQCLQNMLQYYNINPQKYEQIFKQQYQSQQLFSQIIKYFNYKIYMFKKSKQQMIKFIIRKTQRYYKIKNNCKKDQRFKKYGGFKSMNSIYLQKLFHDQQFVDAFVSIVDNFIQKFQQQNQSKLNLFIQKIFSSRNQQQFQLSLKILDQKNKMPWPTYWIFKFKKVIEQLNVNYIANHHHHKYYLSQQHT